MKVVTTTVTAWPYLPVFERWARDLGLVDDWRLFTEAIKRVYSAEQIAQAFEKDSPFRKYLKGGK